MDMVISCLEAIGQWVYSLFNDILEILRRMVCPTAEAMSASNISSDRDVYLRALETSASKAVVFQAKIRIPRNNLIIFFC